MICFKFIKGGHKLVKIAKIAIIDSKEVSTVTESKKS